MRVSALPASGRNRRSLGFGVVSAATGELVVTDKLALKAASRPNPISLDVVSNGLCYTTTKNFVVVGQGPSRFRSLGQGAAGIRQPQGRRETLDESSRGHRPDDV